MSLRIVPARKLRKGELHLWCFLPEVVVLFDYTVVGDLQRNEYFRARQDWLEHHCGDQAWMGSYEILFARKEDACHYILVWDN